MTIFELLINDVKDTSMLTSFVIITFVSLTASCLTLYSGFGLGTLLLPVFTLFFPVEAAIAATAIVHGANNVLKASMVGKYANKTIIIQFGVPAIIAAIAGASALGYVSHMEPIARFSIFFIPATVTPVKLLTAIMMFVFALFELVPRLKQIKVSNKYLPLGWLLSGFFGGFSGHQGALRSTFLTKVGISTESFVGTNAVIGLMVDAIRITTYTFVFINAGNQLLFAQSQWALIGAAVAAAFTGVLIGKRYLHKITMKVVQNITGCFLLAIAVALGIGLI